MNDEHSLNGLLKRYREGALGKKQLESRLFQYVLRNHRCFGLARWDEGTRIDYLCWLYPRISRAIERYRDDGVSFDAYIGTVVRLNAREYHITAMKHTITEYACWSNRALEANELAAGDTEAPYGTAYGAVYDADVPDGTSYGAEARDDTPYGAKAADSTPYGVKAPYGAVCAEADGEVVPPPFKQVQNPQQTLILLLKSYYFLSEDYINRAAPALGLERNHLMYLVDELRGLREEQEDAIRALQKRVQVQFYRSISFEYKLRALDENTACYQQMLRRLERSKGRLKSLRKRLKNTRIGASNRQIATVLGLPKGTVDSNLFAVKSAAIPGVGRHRSSPELVQ
jgi:hypothetical protein